MVSSTKYQIRSISFPAKSHPSISSVEEGLNNVLNATWQNDSSSLCEGFSMLEDLYGRVDDLLNMGATQQALSRNNNIDQSNNGHVEALLETSVKLLDVCEVTREVLSNTNEHVREVQSAIRRRRKGDSSDLGLETCVSSYVCFRKKAKKEFKRLISTLIKSENNTLENYIINSNDDRFVAVVGVLRRVYSSTVLVLRSLLSFVSESKSMKSKSNWSLVAKFMHKGRVIACEDDKINRQYVNEFESVDSDLIVANNKNIDMVCEARRHMEALETGVYRLESCLEVLFRRLIRTRASLLNIISQ